MPHAEPSGAVPDGRMKLPFTRRVTAEGASPDLDPVFEDDGRFTAESLARIRAAAERGHVIAMANLGAGLLAAGDRAGALRWLGKAWEAGNVPAGFNLGMVYAMAGDANRAQVIWERCAELGDADAMLGLVRQALERGEPASAERWLHAIFSQPDVFPVTALGFALAEHGHVAEAVSTYRIAVDRGDAYAMEYLADILDSQGSREEAKALRERAKTAERML